MQALADEVNRIRNQEMENLRKLMIQEGNFVVPLRVQPNVANLKSVPEKSPLQRGGLTMGSSRHQLALKVFEKLLARVGLTPYNFNGSSTEDENSSERIYYEQDTDFIPSLVRASYRVLEEFEKHILKDPELYPTEKKPRKRAERQIDLSD